MIRSLDDAEKWHRSVKSLAVSMDLARLLELEVAGQARPSADSNFARSGEAPAQPNP
jgi:hypothetical protein